MIYVKVVGVRGVFYRVDILRVDRLFLFEKYLIFFIGFLLEYIKIIDFESLE